MKTSVIFRTYKKDGDVIALFPELPADLSRYHCLSYQSIGQHGAAISVSDSEAEDLANARLIAAAPDTTERLSITTHMLENLVADMRTGKRFSEQAVANVHMVIEANRAAIARATGNQ